MLISTFLKDNNLGVNQLYEVLRYPTNKSLDAFTRYTKLKYQEGKSSDYVSQVVADVRELSREVVKVYRDKEQHKEMIS